MGFICEPKFITTVNGFGEFFICVGMRGLTPAGGVFSTTYFDFEVLKRGTELGCEEVIEDLRFGRLGIVGEQAG